MNKHNEENKSRLNEKKICIITCVNDEEKYNELYVSFIDLVLPQGFVLDFVAMRGEKSIFSAYQKAMKQSDAKYKIYVHQDIIVHDKKFLLSMVKAFQENPCYGILGVIGAVAYDVEGIWWNSIPVGAIIDNTNGVYKDRRYFATKAGLQPAAALDGCILMTQYDVDWRTDIFHDWHMYDVSQTLEFLRKGYRAGVITQPVTACRHRCGKPSLRNYDAAREVFLQEYRVDIARARQQANKENLLPLVTCIMPVQGRSALFAAVLDSILAQTYLNFELFICDSSQDGNIEKLLGPYRNASTNIIYEHHPEYKSVEENWQRCWRYDNPKAKYVTWMLEGDIFLQEKLETMVARMETHPNVAMIASSRQYIDAEGREVRNNIVQDPSAIPVYMFKGEQAGRAMLSDKENFISIVSSSLIRKSALKDGTALGSLQEGDLIYSSIPLSIHVAQTKKNKDNMAVQLALLVEWGRNIRNFGARKIFLTSPTEYQISVNSWLTAFEEFTQEYAAEEYGNAVQLLELLRLAEQMIEN